MKLDHIIQAFAGSYALVNTTRYTLNPNGTETFLSFENKTTGIITYTTRGIISVIMTNPTNRPEHLLWPPAANDSDADWALIGRSIMSYTTRFHIGKEMPATSPGIRQGQILHGPIDVANVPSLVGTTLAREYTMSRRDGDEYLLLQALNPEATSRNDILWRRIA
ncbi:hypothetical protein B0H66DRAFT_641960 [Apodospora peruviana]|uniref:Lipocalin-like domain-containing protein n=1 Tax=Apodospora peruviana TaxID=516989 RepID=A0AAE0M0E3_9PEZI|nr:hypothetical protein B0H66DRAFT_641960 [Apodospora peruviana]